MKKRLMFLMAVTGWFAVIADIVGVAPTVTVTSWPNGTTVTGSVELGYNPMGTGNVTVLVDGAAIASATNSGSFWWTPQTTGAHTLTHEAGDQVWNLTVNVTKLDRVDTKEPAPPMEVVETITITPTEWPFAANGGMRTIKTSGTGDWTAAVSDEWITLNSTAGTAGASVAYRVAENTAVEARTGYVYVAGRVFTVTQAGVGATLDRGSADINSAGGEGTVTVNAADGAAWRAWSNADWLSVSCTEGEGTGTVTWSAAPWNERSTRTGTLTIAGQPFTVTQEGQFVWLGEERVSCDAKGREIEIVVNTLTEEIDWSVASNDDWIHVMDAGSGVGNGCVRIAVDENTGYWERTGTVTVRREVFTVTQAARPPDVAAFETAFDARGSAVTVGVTTDERVPWTVEGLPEWLTASANEGKGSGEIELTAAVNTTLRERSAEIVIAGRVFTVTQAAREVSVDCDVTVFAGDGEMGVVTVDVEDDVEWSAEIDVDWILVWGDTSGTGCGEIEFIVDFCEEEECARTGTIRVGDKTIVISQRAGMTLETAVPVPYSWLEGYYGTMDEAGYEAKAKETAANGVNTVEEAYVIGFDPRDAGKRFVAGIEMGADGEVKVTWDPDLNEGGTKRERVYRVWGRETLEGGDWVEVTEGTRDEGEGTRDEGQGMRGRMQFFKVTVEMP